ncbi:MAG: tRNA (N6-isopentenyl adenosine(37)-C2)-methylthiotransferase MiaB [Alphaproteobacteria bacterium]|nr:tRNA (N6-isopentenyl adenosine(37)-C2)-methylthiotransferase MiaB [Alphaproteobacteria bacterium]
MPKTLHIKTYGCQMNVYDSERIAEVLAPLGYAPGETAEAADMVILNTCHIREKAAEKVYSELGRLRIAQEAKARRGERMIIAVTGCVAQAEGEEVLKRAPFVDMVFGPQTYHRLPQMVAEATRATGHVLDTDFPEESKFDALPEARTVDGAAAFLAVQEGCDKFCTYCVVPYTRGAEYSRPAARVLDEARRLVEAGAREITLLGQNVNSYHGEGPGGGAWTLARLIRAVAELDGVERIRYTTSYPADLDADLIAAHRDVDKLMPYLHLPIQSGSNRVLDAMNRKHTTDDYKRLVDQLRAARPDLALSSDFIVGFPGETDTDFEDTLKLVADVTFIQAYSFKYSARPGTPAAMMDFQVDEAVKAARLARLQDLLNTQTLAFNRSMVGRTLAVLLDRPGKKPGQMAGRSPYMQAVVVEAPAERINTIQAVTVTSGGPNSLLGRIDGAIERACA